MPVLQHGFRYKLGYRERESAGAEGTPALSFWLSYEDFRGGEGGIRTHGAHRSAVFKTAAFNRSATSPYRAGMTRSSGSLGTVNFTIRRSAPGRTDRRLLADDLLASQVRP